MYTFKATVSVALGVQSSTGLSLCVWQAAGPSPSSPLSALLPRSLSAAAAAVTALTPSGSLLVVWYFWWTFLPVFRNSALRGFREKLPNAKMDWSNDPTKCGYIGGEKKGEYFCRERPFWGLSYRHGRGRRASGELYPRSQGLGPTAAAEAVCFKWNTEHREGLCSDVAFPPVGKFDILSQVCLPYTGRTWCQTPVTNLYISGGFLFVSECTLISCVLDVFPIPGLLFLNRHTQKKIKKQPLQGKNKSKKQSTPKI